MTSHATDRRRSAERHATARLFVAVGMPPLVRERLAGWARAALSEARTFKGRVAPPRLLEAEYMHLTLCFLGSRPVGEIAPLVEAVGACTRAVGEITLGAPVWLPPRRPRALAVEVHDDTGDLEALRDEVLEALAGVCAPALKPERRRFRPHITVARLRQRLRAEERRLMATPSLSFTPLSLVLYRSWLAAEGASYEALTQVALVSGA